MNNHYHLLLETPPLNLSAGMKWFQGTYTQRYNVRHKLSGHLFQGRYKAIPGFKKADPRKQALAWWVKSQSIVGDEWIVQHLEMGHRSNVSRAVSAFRTVTSLR